MIAELISIDITYQFSENILAFDLNKAFENFHQLKLIFTDKKKGTAYFLTQSAHDFHQINDSFIDCIHLLKFSVNAG
jgi:hypothetical protein